MTTMERIDMGRLRSCARAMVLDDVSKQFINTVKLGYGRETEVCNDCWLIKPDTTGTNGECRPDQGEQPKSFVPQRGYYLLEIEIHLFGSRCIGRQASLDKSLLFFGEPLCRGRDWSQQCQQGRWRKVRAEDRPYNLVKQSRWPRRRVLSPLPPRGIA